MNVSFAPLRPDAIAFLESQVGVDYRNAQGFPAPRWFCVTARDDEGAIMGVIVCEKLSGFEYSFHSAVLDPRCATRRLLKAVYTALFSEAVRLTALIEITNARALRNAAAMGFVYEGFCRRGLDGVSDAYTYGMLREDCKFLPDYAGGTKVMLDHAPHVTRRSRHG